MFRHGPATVPIFGRVSPNPRRTAAPMTRLAHYRFSLLLCVVLANILVLAIELPRPWNEFLSSAISLVAAMNLFLITRQMRDVWVLIFLGTGGYVLDLAIPWDVAHPAVNLIKIVCWLGASTFLAVRVFATIYVSTSVRRDDIAGALAVYLLLALIFANVFDVILLFDPDSLRFGDHFPAEEFGFGEVIYFSFVTLATLGYGDISPTAPLARAVAVVESLSGIVYLAVMISFFVSRYARRYASFEEQENKE